MLAAAGERRQVERFRIDGKVAVMKIKHLGVSVVRDLGRSMHHFIKRSQSNSLDLAAGRAGGPVDVMIEAPQQAVHHALHIRAAETGVNDLLDVGHAVAVGVLGIDDVGRIADEHAAAVADDSRRPGKFVEEHLARFVFSVAVFVREQADAAQEIFVLLRVVAHFNDVHLAVFIRRNCHRIDHLRLGGDKLHAIAGRHFRDDSNMAAAASA